MSEVTKENMLFHLKHGCSFYPVCPICNAIRALIEHGLEVDEIWIRNRVDSSWIDGVYNTPKFRNWVKALLREAGVTVKE